MHVKKDDLVVIISGKERGLRGRILKVLPRENRVIVEGRNLVKRHLKPNPLIGREGGIVEKEAPIHASNVLLYSEKKDGPVRTQRWFEGQDKTLFATLKEALATYDTPPPKVRKVRYCPKTKERFD
ncbi:MAG: 50S ribosomal protein L24 [Myxococcota bacterium]